ncbi:MAG: hypothetical protein K9M94_11145 [Spirochaetia bacterium]|nr:hypothetical protein [Spirochaetia bacterium]
MALTVAQKHRRSTAVAVFLLSTALLFLGPAQRSDRKSSALLAYPGDVDIITAEFWTELDPIMEGSQPPAPKAEVSPSPPLAPLTGSGVLSQDEAIRRTLEEARLVLSGMIYGFDLRYTPSDRARNVAEELVIEPRARIPAGDRALRVLQVRTAGNKYFVHIRYDLAEHQQRRMQAWSSNTLSSAGGRGTASLQQGYRGKFESFNQAIKNALREYLRPRYKNKPSRIQAVVVLKEPPYTVIDAGGYHSKVRIKIDVREVRPYSAY